MKKITDAIDLLNFDEPAKREPTRAEYEAYWLDKDTDLPFEEWLVERARLAFIAGLKMQMLEESPELDAMMTDKEYEAIREMCEITAAANLPADERFLP